MKAHLFATTAVTVAALSVSGLGTALADSVSGLVTLTAGTSAKASDVNGNFAAVKRSVDDNHARITTIEASNRSTSAGDMRYWNGTAWVAIPAPPSNPGDLRLTFCKGVPKWGCSYAIGDTGPAGGVVFFVYDNGQHGLEAARSDLPSTSWCNNTGLDPNGKDISGRRIGVGRDNTLTIASLHCTSGAVVAAASHSSGGVRGWFLPSLDEMNLLYAQRTAVGGFSANFYWTSTSTTTTGFAMTVRFDDGSNPSLATGAPAGSVRPIRAF